MANKQVHCLDDVEAYFKSKIGHEPKTVQQMLSFCKQNGLQYKYIDINKWWFAKLQTKSAVHHNTVELQKHYNTDANRASWKLNSWLLAYSRSKNEWYPGEIQQYVGEKWLVIKYNKTTKKIQRKSKHLKHFPLNHPLLFKKGTKCKIYSAKILKWCDAEVINIYIDDEGEWLQVQYDHKGTPKICDIQRFSNDLIFHHDLDGVWNENIKCIEMCNIDNIIYILRYHILVDEQFKNKKLLKFKEKIVAYFYKNKINGAKIVEMTEIMFAEELFRFLSIKNNKKLRNSFMKIFNSFSAKIDVLIVNIDEKMEREPNQREKNADDHHCSHHFNQKRFFVHFG